MGLGRSPWTLASSRVIGKSWADVRFENVVFIAWLFDVTNIASITKICNKLPLSNIPHTLNKCTLPTKAFQWIAKTQMYLHVCLMPINDPAEWNIELAGWSVRAVSVADNNDYVQLI